MSSDGQGLEQPHGYTGTGTKGKGQGVDLKTPEKPVPSSRVRVTLGIYRGLQRQAPSENRLRPQLQISVQSLQRSEDSSGTDIHRPHGILSLLRIFFREDLRCFYNKTTITAEISVSVGAGLFSSAFFSRHL